MAAFGRPLSRKPGRPSTKLSQSHTGSTDSYRLAVAPHNQTDPRGSQHIAHSSTGGEQLLMPIDLNLDMSLGRTSKRATMPGQRSSHQISAPVHRPHGLQSRSSALRLDRLGSKRVVTKSSDLTSPKTSRKPSSRSKPNQHSEPPVPTLVSPIVSHGRSQSGESSSLASLGRSRPASKPPASVLTTPNTGKPPVLHGEEVILLEKGFQAQVPSCAESKRALGRLFASDYLHGADSGARRKLGLAGLSSSSLLSAMPASVEFVPPRETPVAFHGGNYCKEGTADTEEEWEGCDFDEGKLIESLGLGDAL